MESGDGVETEHVNGGLEEDQIGTGLLCVDKENENTENGANGPQVNGVHDTPESVQGIKASGAEGEILSVVSSSAEHGHIKKAGSAALGHPKKGDTQKGEVGKKALGGVGRKQMPSLSQSLTFPSKGILTSDFRKSVGEVKYANVNSTSLRTNGSDTKAATTGKVSANRNNLASVTRTRQLPVSKPSGVTLKTSEVHRNLKPSKEVAPNKTDEDAHSTTSGASLMRKSTGSGFAFRLNERAEKRKEFFMKLEEKTHAIEVEKTNQQEKSKEDQEAEIKQLRKTLTFKATPMPSFYKEPAPPKTELKKIPTTRPISPKLGRRKTSAAAPEITIEAKAAEGRLRPSLSPSLKQNLVSDTIAGISAKNPVRKSIAKLPSQKKTGPKSESKLLDMNLKDLAPTIEAVEVDRNTADIENNYSGHQPLEVHPLEIENQPKAHL